MFNFLGGRAKLLCTDGFRPGLTPQASIPGRAFRRYFEFCAFKFLLGHY